MSSTDWHRRPELALANVIERAFRDDFEQKRTYYRAVVVAVDLDGGLLQNPDGAGEFVVPLRDGSTRKYKALIGPNNPRGSVKARILTDGLDRLLGDNELKVYWPMFPQDLSGTPISPGEHVFVLFEENDSAETGLWVSRVAGHESANSFEGKNSYTAPSSQQSSMDKFEENPPEYQRDENYASLAPSNGAMTSFEDE